MFLANCAALAQLISHWNEKVLLKRNRKLVLDNYNQVKVTDSTFYDISSTENGGAISFINNNADTSLIIERLFIQHCHTNKNGGAICASCKLCNFSKICGYECTADGFGQFYVAQSDDKNILMLNSCLDSSFCHASSTNGEISLSNSFGNIELSGINISYVDCKEFSCMQISPISFSYLDYSSFSNNTVSQKGFVFLSDKFAIPELYVGPAISYVNFLSNKQLNKNSQDIFGIIYVTGPSGISYSNFILNDVVKILAQFPCSFSTDIGLMYSTFEHCYIDQNYDSFYTGKSPIADNKNANEVLFKIEFLKTAKCEIQADHIIKGFYGEQIHLTCNYKKKTNFIPQLSIIAVFC